MSLRNTSASTSVHGVTFQKIVLFVQPFPRSSSFSRKCSLTVATYRPVLHERLAVNFMTVHQGCPHIALVEWSALLLRIRFGSRISRWVLLSFPLHFQTTSSVTSSMEQSLYCEATTRSCSVIQEIVHIVWELEVPLPCSQEHATGVFSESDDSTARPPACFVKIHFNIILFQMVSFLQFFQPELCMHIIFSPMRAAWPAHSILNLINIIVFVRIRDSSVGIATGYGLDDRGGGSSSPGRVKKISLLHIVQTGSGGHPTSYKMGTGGKAAGTWSWPLTSN
jgi:hypothetical protein